LTFCYWPNLAGYLQAAPICTVSPNLGDFVAVQLYEDLLAMARSTKLVSEIEKQLKVVN
jgi:hypothetical protein